MTEIKNIGIRLKTARMAAGFKSAKDFCTEFNIPSSTYSFHETGGRNLTLKAAEKYAELLGVSAAWLLTGTGSPYKNQSEDGDSTISNEQFLELLKYKGNRKIQKSQKNKDEIINNVNPLVLCKIIIGMTKILNDLNFQLEETQLSRKAVEIYKDIIKSSQHTENQLTMITLSMTTFKRQVQEIITTNKNKAANE